MSTLLSEPAVAQQRELRICTRYSRKIIKSRILRNGSHVALGVSCRKCLCGRTLQGMCDFGVAGTLRIWLRLILMHFWNRRRRTADSGTGTGGNGENGGGSWGYESRTAQARGQFPFGKLRRVVFWFSLRVCVVRTQVLLYTTRRCLSRAKVGQCSKNHECPAAAGKLRPNDATRHQAEPDARCPIRMTNDEKQARRQRAAGGESLKFCERINSTTHQRLGNRTDSNAASVD
jgi:hypothetical protein